MKKKIFIALLCMFTLLIPVYAENTNGNGGSTTGGNTTTGNNDSTKAAEKAEAREKKVTIRAQLQQLKTLRTQLKSEIKTKQQLMLQYKAQDSLTEAQKTEVKSMISTMKSIQEKLGTAYHNAAKAVTQYKKDTSSNKLTGLDLVIESQRIRIGLLQDAIAELQ